MRRLRYSAEGITQQVNHVLIGIAQTSIPPRDQTGHPKKSFRRNNYGSGLQLGLGVGLYGLSRRKQRWMLFEASAQTLLFHLRKNAFFARSMLAALTHSSVNPQEKHRNRSTIIFSLKTAA